jgi:hypothetical protein
MGENVSFRAAIAFPQRDETSSRIAGVNLDGDMMIGQCRT